MLVLRHLTKRKKRVEHQPQTVRTVFHLAWLDVLIYAASIMGPLALLPQVLKLYATHEASGLALPSWTMFGVLNLIWVFYGYKHHEKPIMITNSALAVLNFAVAVGIVLFT